MPWERWEPMIAVCGLDCANECGIYRCPHDPELADEHARSFRENGFPDAEPGWFHCGGCRGDRSQHWSADCTILNCCVGTRHLQSCSQCGEFPCHNLEAWASKGERVCWSARPPSRDRGECGFVGLAGQGGQIVSVIKDFTALEDRFEAPLYPKRGITLVRGLGARVWDDQGREYIDCVGGHGVANIGHCNPEVVLAIQEQAATLVTCSEVFHNDKRALLLERLAQVVPAGLDSLFLCNSGTEAIEAAIKFARLTTGRTGIVATMRGFHGRTMGSLSLTWEKEYREPFVPLIPNVQHVPYDNLQAAEQVLTDDCAAMVVEVVQGEGGVRPASAEYIQGLRRLCTERGVLLVIDEVQTGFGRTGRMFACEHHDVVPDIMAMGKAIGGGVPMGGVACNERVRQALHPGLHGSTFGGNPLACAAALASLDFIETSGLPRQAAQKGQYFMGRLSAIKSRAIREVRGLGLIVGIECRQKVQPYLQALMGKGVLALPAGSTVLRFLPPLVIGLDELDRVADAVAEVLG